MEHKEVKRYATRIEPVGSRVTCNPAPTNTDQDYLVLCKNEACFYDLIEDLRYVHDYELCGDGDYFVPAEEGFQEDYFLSFRKGDLNYILTCNQEFFNDFMNATAIAKEHNLLHKHERVYLFQWMLYDNISDAHDVALDEAGVSGVPTVEQMIAAIRSVPKEVL